MGKVVYHVSNVSDENPNVARIRVFVALSCTALSSTQRAISNGGARQQRNVYGELNDLSRTIVEDAEVTSGTTYESGKRQTFGASRLPSSSIKTSAKHRMSTLVPMRDILDNVQDIPYE